MGNVVFLQYRVPRKQERSPYLFAMAFVQYEQKVKGLFSNIEEAIEGKNTGDFFTLRRFVEHGSRRNVNAELLANFLFLIKDYSFSPSPISPLYLMRPLLMPSSEAQEKFARLLNLLIATAPSLTEKKVLVQFLGEVTSAALTRADLGEAAKNLEKLEAAGVTIRSIAERGRFLLLYHYYYFKAAGIETLAEVSHIFKAKGLYIDLPMLQAIMEKAKEKGVSPIELAKNSARLLEKKPGEENQFQEILNRAIIIVMTREINTPQEKREEKTIISLCREF